MMGIVSEGCMKARSGINQLDTHFPIRATLATFPSMDIDCYTHLQAYPWLCEPQLEYSPQFDDDAEDTAKSVVAAVPALMQMLRDADNEKCKITAKVLCELAFDDETKQLLLSINVLEFAVELMYRNESGDCEQIVVLLLTLCTDEDFRRLLLKGTLESVITFLRNSKTLRNEQVGEALLTLSKYEELQLPLADAGVIPLLIELVEEANEGTQCLAAAALWNLTQPEINTTKVLSDDTLSDVINLLTKLLEDTKLQMGLERAIDLPTSLPTLVRLFCDGTYKVKASLIDLFYAIVRGRCSRPRENCLKIAAAGALPTLLVFLFEHGHDQENALRLLNWLSRANKLAAVSAGTIRTLVALAQIGTSAQMCTAAKELADFVETMKSETPQVPVDDINTIVALARSTTGPIRGNCVMALACLAKDDANRSHILSTDALSSALSILHAAEKSSYHQAAAFFQSIAVNDKGINLLSAAGAVAPLVFAIRDSSKYVGDGMINALAKLAQNSAANKALIAEKGGIQALVSATRALSSSAKSSALLVLTQLSINSDKNKQKIAASGVLAELIAFLRSGSHSLMYRSLRLLKSLSVNNTAGKQIVAAGAIEPVVALVAHTSTSLACLAIGVLQNLAVTSHHKATIAATSSIDTLLARVYGADEKLANAALGALINLSIKCSENRKTMASKGVASELVEILLKGDGEKRFRALSLLSELSQDPECRDAIAATSAVAVLTKLVGVHKPYSIRKEAALALHALSEI